MTKAQEKKLNDFFVHDFNKINNLENQALRRIGARNLSVKEIHVLEAVSEQAQRGQNTMSAIAESLSIQTSTLSTSVRTLVRKGYLTRQNGVQDRRQVYITLTEKGEAANRAHSQFHAQMVHSAAAQFSDEEIELLTQMLEQLDRFFAEMLELGEGRGNASDDTDTSAVL
ncbi:MAG: winged helix DNA-binding protein [Oscillospiraceae bacterium]|nr:winged helix DNA-binding protein [Oscillospiraceae bacterium]